MFSKPGMTMHIEDYAIVGNCETVALVGRNGAIDWLCWPRFESQACFAALLGDENNGRWVIAPIAPARVTRRYRPDTLVLETTFACAEGTVTLIDCMRRSDSRSDLIRIVRGDVGNVRMHGRLIVRFDYGLVVPWVSRLDDGRLAFVAGPQRLVLDSDVEVQGKDLTTTAEFDVHAGNEVAFTLSWSVSFRELPERFDARAAVDAIAQDWRQWRAQCSGIEGPYTDAVLQSLLTLKALTHHETGGIAAAATTSLPEELGGARNWDYRYCWLRDSAFTLFALMGAGFIDEARRWREWLVRAVAGSPAQVQTMYDVLGRRPLFEYELSWLSGYESSYPVRVGNAAHKQFQLDIYGEVIDSLFIGRSSGLAELDAAWDIEIALIERVIEVRNQPDAGIWEFRGPPQHFTHSKVMAWVALDRAVRNVTQWGLHGDIARWSALRDHLHEQICASAFNPKLGAFVQAYGSDELDASTLLLPLVGFLPASDPRIHGTIAAIERELMVEGLVRRYRTEAGVDGLGGGSEGVFLACSFWLVDNYTLLGRWDDARRLYERLLGLRNDVGLLAEQYDTAAQRMVGNFPQVFSHVGIINSARNLMRENGPARQRGLDGYAWDTLRPQAP